MARATYYKELLCLDFPDCNVFEVESWTDPRYESRLPEVKKRLHRYNLVHRWVHGAKLFSMPKTGEGWPHSKPNHYLAIALVESGKSDEEVLEAVKKLKAVHAADVNSKVDANGHPPIRLRESL